MPAYETVSLGGVPDVLKEHGAINSEINPTRQLAHRIRMEQEFNPDPAEIVPLPIMKSISLYTQQWYMSYRFADSL